jgi:Ribonuclease G/E
MMSSSYIYLECFANGCRLLHLIDEKPVAAFIDLDNTPHYGDIFWGRILRLEPTYAWIDIGASKPALLKRKKQELYEGQSIAVRITRQAISNAYENKGSQVVRENMISTHKAPHLLQEAEPQWLEYLLSLPTAQGTMVYVKHADLFQKLRQTGLAGELSLVLQQIAPTPPIVQQVWDEITGAMHPLPQGGHLIVEETVALTVFDVNTTGIEDQHSSRQLANIKERFKFNQLAAQTIFNLIQLRHIGGTIMVDFLKFNESSLNHQLLIYLKKQALSVKDMRVLGFTPGGLLELRRPVYGPSLYASAQRLKVNNHDQS